MAGGIKYRTTIRTSRSPTVKAWGTVRRCPNKVSPIQINIMTPRHMGAVAEGVKPQSHRAYDQVTTLQSWSNRRKNVRLVAEVVCDRQGKISRCKFVVMFKTPKSQSHRAYDQVTTYLRQNFFWNRGQFV